MDSVDLSIIIVNWNTRDYLRACLESIYKHPPHKYTFEVIVVDNASRDGSVDMVRQEFPQVRLIANDYNYGFAKATNQGYRISRGRYVMSLNPDTEVFEGTLNSIIEFLDAHPRVGLVAPAVVDENGRATVFASTPADIPSKIELPVLARLLAKRFRLLGKEKSLTAPDSGVVEAQVVWGTGLTCRREALDHAYFFDEGKFMFYEELNLCKKIIGSNYIISGLSRARIRHHAGASRLMSPATAHITGRLHVANWYDLRREMFGTFNAKLNSFLLLIDSVIVYLLLYAKSILLGRTRPREIALAEWKGKLLSYFELIVKGRKYVEEMNRFAEDFLNRYSVPFGPEDPRGRVV